MLIFHVSILTTTKENSLNLSLILFQRGKPLPKMSNHGIQFIFKTQFWLESLLSFYQMWRRLLSIIQILFCKHSEFVQGICDMKISDTGEQLMAAQILIQHQMFQRFTDIIAPKTPLSKNRQRRQWKKTKIRFIYPCKSKLMFDITIKLKIFRLLQFFTLSNLLKRKGQEKELKYFWKSILRQ